MAERPQAEPVFEPGELAALLAAGGAVARAYDGFEDRAEQRRMIEAVGEAFSRDRVLLVEAGTGTGKSLAYALPAALWAQRANSRVVLSTGTINLQEQLVGKDLPLVARALRSISARELNVVLVKGRGNYLCQRRLADRLRQRTLFAAGELASLLDALADWAGRTRDGSRSDLDLPVPEQAWQLVCADADACLGRRCPQRNDCFFARARLAAEEADLLVVNHHLLFADLALRLTLDDFERRAVLPPFERVVLDEGHSLEDVASGFFGLQLTRTGALRTLGQLGAGSKKPGLLAELADELGVLGASHARGGGPLAAQAGEARAAVDRAFDGLMDFAERCALRAVTGDRKLRLTAELLAAPDWVPVRESFGQAAWQADKLAVALEGLVDELAALSDEESRAAEGRSGVRRLLGLSGACRRLADDELDEAVRWVELPPRAGGRHVRLAEAPLEVASRLQAALFEPMRTAIITSATLAVGGSFDYLAGRLGIDRLGAERAETLLLDSPFDFAGQAELAVVTDAPAPTEPGFEDWLPEAVFRLATAAGGGALVLFTAWGSMTRAFELVRDRLEALGLEPLCQGLAPRDRLLRRFREQSDSVLFGTDSFWQGVDVVGQALRLVIVARLPFDVPSDPLVQARSEQVAARGLNAFGHFALPRAVLRLKQGFGRLIRSGADRGAVVLLDQRVASRSYGRRFVDSLPPAKLVFQPLDQVVDGVADLRPDL